MVQLANESVPTYYLQRRFPVKEVLLPSAEEPVQTVLLPIAEEPVQTVLLPIAEEPFQTVLPPIAEEQVEKVTSRTPAPDTVEKVKQVLQSAAKPAFSRNR